MVSIEPVIRRVWAMPSAETFSIPPIAEFVARYMARGGVSVDPFARNGSLATYTNDLNPKTSAQYHMQATDFLQMLADRGVKADVVLLDPPYSPRQIVECYQSARLTVSTTDTQNARLYRECRDYIRQLAAPECVVLSFGWNSAGMGKGWTRLETLLVAHGGAHNDTICVADQNKDPVTQLLHKESP